MDCRSQTSRPWTLALSGAKGDDDSIKLLDHYTHLTEVSSTQQRGLIFKKATIVEAECRSLVILPVSMWNIEIWVRITNSFAVLLMKRFFLVIFPCTCFGYLGVPCPPRLNGPWRIGGHVPMPGDISPPSPLLHLLLGGTSNNKLLSAFDQRMAPYFFCNTVLIFTRKAFPSQVMDSKKFFMRTGLKEQSFISIFCSLTFREIAGQERNRPGFIRINRSVVFFVTFATKQASHRTQDNILQIKQALSV